MFSGLFLSRFTFGVSDRQLGVPLIAIVLSIAGLAAAGTLRVHVPRLILFALSVAAMIAATLLGGAGRVSAMSLLLLVVLYFSYVFVADAGEDGYAWAIVAFRRMCLVLADAGIVQFVAQLAVPGPTLFTFRGYVPDAYLALQYNYVDPVGDLTSLYKSNGFFLPEPSIFGQVMGLAAIAEVLFFRPSYRLFVFGLALFLSFSGTGVILCALFLPLILRRANPALLFVAACLGLLLVTFAGSPYLEPFVGRIGEFGAQQSSGFARFLSPFYLFNDFVFTSVRNTLFGLGPGAIETFFHNFYTEVHDPTWGKLFLEYGIVGTLPFALFIFCCFFGDPPSRWMSGALFFDWLLLGGYLLSAPLAGIILSLAVWHRAPRTAQRRTARAIGRVGAALQPTGGPG